MCVCDSNCVTSLHFFLSFPVDYVIRSELHANDLHICASSWDLMGCIGAAWPVWQLP